MKKMFFAAILIFACILALPVFCGCEPENENSTISTISEESVSPEKPEVIRWLSFSEYTDRKEYTKTPLEYTLPEMDGVTMRFNRNTVECVFEDGTVYELPVTELINAYFADLNGDGIRELCVTAKTTELWNDAFDTLSYRGWAYDLVSKRFYSTVPSSEQGFGWVLRTYDNEIYAMPWSYVQYVYAEPCKIVLDEEQNVLECESVTLPHEVVESFCYWPANPYNLLRFNTKENGAEASYYVLLEDHEVEAFEQILSSYEYEKTTDPQKAPLACDLIVYDALLNVETCKMRMRFGRDMHLFEEYPIFDWYLADDYTAAEDYIKSFMEDALPYYQ